MYRSHLDSYPYPPRRGNLRFSLFFFITLFVCALGAVLAPVLTGAIVGYQELQIQNHEKAIQHYQRGLGYLGEGYPDLAMAEFQISLRYDGGFDPARERFGALQTRVAEQRNPAGPQGGNTIAAKMLVEARTYVSQKQWGDAITRLEQLRGLDANFQTQVISDLLFQSYVESGKEAQTSGQIELARERFDAALNVRKDTEALRQRDLATLYLDGQQAAANDLPGAIQKFATLYQQDPNYNDVKKRLVDAYLAYGDRAAKENAWCLAAREYDRASAISGDAQSSQKYTQAITRCKQATVATPTVSPAVTPGGESYALLRNIPTTQPCTGSGDISGSLRDALGNQLVGFFIAYEGDNINRIATSTDTNGQYKLTLGRDAAALRVFVLGGDGKTPVGFIVNVQYPGGSNPGCHIVVDWQKAQ